MLARKVICAGRNDEREGDQNSAGNGEEGRREEGGRRREDGGERRVGSEGWRVKGGD